MEPKDIVNTIQGEEQEWNQTLRDVRIKEQFESGDYSEGREKCDNCGSLLNSHDHCNRCDY